ncbi:N-acylneuraminate cytidylyltransferase [Flavobacterium sp. 270]|uniref:acylneuraminate cytidylyltransferase family protein n=1 Tax=Flavobacterium sp. 270 TaxID=2512114 RepID=UPI00106703C5|nr:acylneuraminate cytidylyltransferase family protein [Flavobacterium sp. 270]TDW47157.1 N-acylneuraminate cytidylyltransferase [Flavobacterium sp. 270]
MKVLAIIPARGGSKGVPRKNVQLLGGIPLIVHAINCAKASSKVTKIIISTDSEEIATIAKENNYEVIMRPDELASDTSNVVHTVEHVYKTLNEDFDIIVLLQPTSPLRTGKDLDSIITMFERNTKLDGIISVVPFDDLHPARMYNLGTNNELVSFIENGESSRRQDLNPVYYRNGCFYAVTSQSFFAEKSFMVKNKEAYIMNPEWLINIDTPRDFKIASIIYEEWKNENFNY